MNPSEPPVVVRDVIRSFGSAVVLDHLSLTVERANVLALLGPNGAGKTTLLRMLGGLMDPTSGHVAVLGGHPEIARGRIGWLPAGDRSFYLRLSGAENLGFYARLHGVRRRAAAARATEWLDRVGLSESATKAVRYYSQGMKKRLAVARAMLANPEVLLFDEATHDLDPAGADLVRRLVRDAADQGAAVVWATQRVDEIRGFADGAVVIDHGRSCFEGRVSDLESYCDNTRFVLRVRNGSSDHDLTGAVMRALAPLGTASADPRGGHDRVVVDLVPDATLSSAVIRLGLADIQVIACRQERSEIEEAIIRLTNGRRA
jgi:ABC-type multidrug transport system ATPase subunit